MPAPKDETKNAAWREKLSKAWTGRSTGRASTPDGERERRRKIGEARSRYLAGLSAEERSALARNRRAYNLFGGRAATEKGECARRLKISAANKANGSRRSAAYKATVAEMAKANPERIKEWRLRQSGARRDWWNKAGEEEKESVRKALTTGHPRREVTVGGRTYSVRSGLEAETMRVLDTNGIAFEYEPFALARPDGRCYMPDFLLSDLGLILEVKARYWMRNWTEEDARQKRAACEAAGYGLAVLLWSGHYSHGNLEPSLLKELGIVGRKAQRLGAEDGSTDKAPTSTRHPALAG